MSGLRRNPPLICAFHALQMSLFPMAILTIFWQHELGFGMGEIFVLQAIFAGTTALFEFPSGVLADRIGYRRSLLWASVLTIAGWSVYLVAPDFWTIAAGEVVLGLGLSLISGSDSAMLYESLLESGHEESFGVWHGRYRFWGQAGEGSAALVAGLLYAFSSRLPFAIEVGAWIAAFGVAWWMVEPERHQPVTENAFAQMRGVASALLQGPGRLKAVMAMSIALSMASFIPVWIIQIYAEKAGVPIAWLGPLWAIANYSVALAALGSAPLGRRIGIMPSLLLCIGLVAVGYLGLGATTAWWGFVFYFLITVMRGLNGSILHHEEQRLIPSADRAGFLSLRSLLFRMSFVVIGPAVGFGVDWRGRARGALGGRRRGHCGLCCRVAVDAKHRGSEAGDAGRSHGSAVKRLSELPATQPTVISAAATSLRLSSGTRFLCRNAKSRSRQRR